MSNPGEMHSISDRPVAESQQPTSGVSVVVVVVVVVDSKCTANCD